MRRKIIKQYDDRNDAHVAHYLKIYEGSVYVQTFRTPIFCRERGYLRNGRPVGCWTKIHEQWLGKRFIEMLYKEVCDGVSHSR